MRLSGSGQPLPHPPQTTAATRGVTPGSRPGHRPEPLLTLPDAADTLRVSTRTVRRLIARGELPVLRVGRQLRLADAGLAAYLRRRLAEG